MDARDSTSNRDVSSSPGGSGTTTGGGGGEDDPILSVTAALAKDAWFHFNSRRFNECLEVLYQLKQKKEDDPKVMIAQITLTHLISFFEFIHFLGFYLIIN
jgi:CCR4-NOT transcription complex subunit 10